MLVGVYCTLQLTPLRLQVEAGLKVPAPVLLKDMVSPLMEPYAPDMVTEQVIGVPTVV